MSSDSYGLTPLERDVVALWDGGASIERIMRERRIGRDTVGKIVGQLGNSSLWRDGDAFNAMVREGSQKLLAAIRRTGRQYS